MAPLPSPKRALRSLSLAILALGGCDPSFDIAREDLGPARIAALGCDTDASGQRIARAALWSGLGLYHEAAPTLSWTLDGDALGEGYDVVVPDGGALGLVATLPDGTALQATVPVADPPRALTLSRAAVDLGDDLTLETRQAATATAVNASAAEGQAERLTLAFAADAGARTWTTHWMLAQGQGTVLPEDTLAADLFAEELTLASGVVTARTALDPGLYPGLALVFDGEGGDRWLWFDAAFGVDTPAVRHGGRLLRLDQADGATVASESAATGWIAATLRASDELAGVALADAASVAAVDGAPDLTEQDALACAPPGEPFQLDWVVEGRCPLPEVLGARVVLAVR